MSAYVPASLRRQVAERFAHCCAYCRTAEHLTVATFEFEHIIPRSSGGLTDVENVCLACPNCNRYKADRVTAIDPDTQQEEPLFHPQRERWTDHFCWNVDGTEIVPLTAPGRATVNALRMNRSQIVRVRKMWVALGEHPPVID